MEGDAAPHEGRALRDLVAAELALPVAPPVARMAAAIAARHPGALGVLFYGSCLREASFDGLMLDFYLIVEDYRRAFARPWLAIANRLLPPNVFPFGQDGLVAKYAVLSAADFMRLNGPDASTVSVWARFAQPSRIAWSAGDGARTILGEAIARAAPTLFRLTLPFMSGQGRPAVLEIWRRGFALTYGAELRAERAGRPGSVVDADPDRYARFGAAVLAEMPPGALRPELTGKAGGHHGAAILRDAGSPRLDPTRAARRWRQLRRTGKVLTLARLAKASATYADGIDYLAWKISRHSGQPVDLHPWQRRWPILGALSLLPRLLIGGAIR